MILSKKMGQTADEDWPNKAHSRHAQRAWVNLQCGSAKSNSTTGNTHAAGVSSAKNNLIQRSLRHVVHSFGIAPIFDVSVRIDRLNYDLFSGLAKGQDKEYLIT